MKASFKTPLFTLFIFNLVLINSSCGHKTPKTTGNICYIFELNSSWLKYSKKSTEKWGTPIHVQMAILNQESKFYNDAKPKRKKLLGFIPWKRASSAYGYAQVLTTTWDQYIKESGNRGADRDKFKDAVDFVGWYTNKTQKLTKVSKWDAYNQYLAYHEGHGGYQRATYKSKKWLLDVAKKVNQTALLYATQLKKCN
jgi:hypothetical protein